MTKTKSPRPRAYSYIRFSTPEQGAGDSLRRQTDKAVKYAAQHNLILDDTTTFRDLGVSAFRGANVAVGALGDFLSLVQSGDIKPGSFLLVENFDRISRDSILDAQAVFTGLLSAGITVVTLSNDRAYSRESLRQNQFAIFEIIIGFIRANDESARKQELLRAAWHGKRLKLKERGIPMTRLSPGWVRLREDRSGFDLIPERAEVVRRVFDLTLAGQGQHAIAQTLNREGVPVFGAGKMWHRSYVKKMLADPSVVGVHTPHRVERIGGRKRRIPTDPVEGYFPAAVDRETFERVGTLATGRGARTAVNGIENVLAGLAVCPKCGSTMTRVNKGSRSRPSLVCVRAKAGKGCAYKSIPCEQVEFALTEKVGEFWRTLPAPDDALAGEWQRLLAAEEGHDEAISNIIDAIKQGGPSAVLLDSLRQVEADRETIKRQISEVAEKVADALTNRTQQTVERLVEGLQAAERDIVAINATMRQLFNKVTVDWPSGYLWFHWKHAPGEKTKLMFAWPSGA
ncbi:recombinase family protein [Mesorhizobium sp. M0085]|uniref:recombinase family protein n=1 Tax=Mesorhizobium sp. M0085 TaxID=2956872 RepID=UPI003336671F